MPIRAHVNEVVWIPVRQGPLDNAQIKQAIRQHGPVYASVGWRGIGNPTYQAYYWPGNSPAHAVALIGWDDRFDRNKFTYTAQGTTYTPAGDGAFIARNNDGGFYSISYYDGTVGYNAVVAFLRHGPEADRLYQHDPYGTRTLITPSTIPGNLNDYIPTLIGANVFTAEKDEHLVALGFFQHPYPGRSEVFHVSVHLDPGSAPFSPGRVVARVAVEPQLGGYHSVALRHPVSLRSGQRFAVLLTGHQVDAEQNFAPLWVEKKPFNDPFEASPGESYVSRDGATWFDLTTVPEVNHETGAEELVYGNLAIKAYAKSASPLSKVEARWSPSSRAIELTNPTELPLELRASVRWAPDGSDAASPGSWQKWVQVGAGERVSVALPSIESTQPMTLQLQLGYGYRFGKLMDLSPWRPIGELKLVPLRVETTSPLPGATVPFPNVEIAARLSRDIKLGPGAGQVVLSSPDSTLATQVSVQGAWLRIYAQGSLTSPSLGGKVWTVTVPADAVTDSSGTSLTEAYSWSFLVIGVN